MASSIFSSIAKLATTILSSLPFSSSSYSSPLPSPPGPPLATKVAGEMEHLSSTVRWIRSVLADAEEREVREESVKLWLSELKQAAYAAEEILGDFDYELLCIRAEHDRLHHGKKRKFEAMMSPTISSPLYEPRFQDQILHRISQVRERLDEIRHDRVALSLNVKHRAAGPVAAGTRPPTSSFADPFGICGRQEEKDRIVAALLDADRGGADTVSIVAMGGMGKTTLAQLVYNDKRVVKHFQLKPWVWVSEVFDVVRLTKAIVEEVTGEPCGLAAPELEPLQQGLQRTLQNKRFLLVLDDVWNEDPAAWDTLRRPLAAGARGSRLIITTRNKNLASITSTRLVVNLQGLPPRDSWDLFFRLAFPGKKSQEDAPPNLVAIGRKIVAKSRGVPLVVRVIGALMSSETREECWEDVMTSDLWELEEGDDYIIRVLRLSYLRLPPALKPCFAYCAALPKRHAFHTDKLVRMWAALGFLGTDEAAQIGASYVDDLIHRSFFQNSPYQNPITFDPAKRIVTMHDLIHDLAVSVASEESLALQHCDSQSIRCNTRLRHLMLAMTDSEVHPPLEPNDDDDGCLSLRSLSLTDNDWFGLQRYVFDCPWLQYLQVLDITFHGSCVLPESIGSFKHLRYLGLSCVEIRLPDSLCNLYNLQTLVVEERSKPDHAREKGGLCLPRNMKQLINLRHLILQARLIKEMPAGIAQLVKLKTLSVFAVGKPEGCARLAELKHLNDLQGELCVTGLDNLPRDRGHEAMEANLNKKSLLTGLILRWDQSSSMSEGHEELEFLRPHTNIQHIVVDGYGGIRLAGWLGDTAYSNVVRVELIRCIECQQIPALGQLPSLKHLLLEGLCQVKRIGPEFYGDQDHPFPSLETLSLTDMAKCEGWWPVEVVDNVIFPRLCTLSIFRCPMLTTLNVFNLPALQEIFLHACSSLTTVIGLEERTRNKYRNKNTTSISSLSLFETPNCVGDAPGTTSIYTIATVSITDCPLLRRRTLWW